MGMHVVGGTVAGWPIDRAHARPRLARPGVGTLYRSRPCRLSRRPLAHAHMARLYGRFAGSRPRQVRRRAQSGADGQAAGDVCAGLAGQSREGLEAAASDGGASAAAGIRAGARLRRGKSYAVGNADRLAHVIEGPASAVNAWRASHWSGRPRGKDNGQRLHLMETAETSLDGALPWLRPP